MSRRGAVPPSVVLLGSVVVLLGSVFVGFRLLTAEADTGARMELGAALTNENVARLDRFTAEPLEPEALGLRVTSVAGAAACLFVRHYRAPTSVCR